jgi:enoyl-CoA hydratase
LILEVFEKLAEAYYQYDHDPSLRAAILFGHGENFSRGIDVEGFKSLAGTGKPWIASTRTIDPLAKRAPRLTKPLIVVTHGDTWNMAHELHLVADIRIASADTRFGQDENTHGRFPGGGSTIRFPQEVGWGNAMRYILTGDHWSAEEAYRMGEVQKVAPDAKEALEAGIRIANKDGITPFVEVFTREKLSDEIHAKLAEELSNTIMTVEVGGPTESAKMIDWM